MFLKKIFGAIVMLGILSALVNPPGFAGQLEKDELTLGFIRRGVYPSTIVRMRG